MRDYWLTRDLLQAAGFGYLVLVMLVVAAAAWFAKGWKTKVVAVVVVLGLASILPLQSMKELTQQRQVQAAAQEQYARAKAVFDERCKSSGEKINRTVENVDGILLKGIRPKALPSDEVNPNWADAALPHESQGDWYIRTFLFWEHNEDKRNARGYLNNRPSDFPGYRFVDVKNADDTVSRYRLVESETAELSHELVRGQSARYAVSFVNIIDPSDREKWIAGTTVLITDTATNDVIAERTWFSFEPGQGSTAGFRSPWAFAESCPSLAGSGGSATRFFVDRVLKPMKGGKV